MNAPTIDLPAGYAVNQEHWAVPGKIHSTTWLVPGGAPVYCHSIVKTPLDNDYWTRVLIRVQHHVQARYLTMTRFETGVSTFKGAVLSDHSPPNTEHLNVNTRNPPLPVLDAVRGPDGTYEVPEVFLDKNGKA